MTELFDIALTQREFPAESFISVVFKMNQSRPNYTFDQDMVQASKNQEMNMRVVDWSADGTEVFLRNMDTRSPGSWWTASLLNVTSVLDARRHVIHDHAMLCRCDSIVRNRKKAA